MTLLGILWFSLAVLLLAIFAVLDGFDLGVGTMYGFTKDPSRRERMLGAISPFWNGNEVWLIAGIGSVLAAFPPVYSALLSTLYIPVMLVLVGIILRACGVELRSKATGAGLERLLDLAIVLGSLIPAWATGLVAGNMLLGFPIDAEGNLQGTFLFFLRPYALLASFASVAAFVMHGALFMTLKSDGADRDAFAGTAGKALAVFAVLAIADVIAAPMFLKARFASASLLPLFIVFTVLSVLAYIGVFLFLKRRSFGKAFAASAVGIASVAAAAGSLLFPVLLPSSVAAANDLTIANSAATDSSLFVMLVIALITVPIVAVYIFVAYRSFKGKAEAVRY